MKFRSAISYLFAVLAIIGFILTPMVRPVMAMPADTNAATDDTTAMADAGTTAMPAEMPCCPEKSPGPDCGKDCPFMALCVATALPGARPASLNVHLTLASVVFPGNQYDLTGIAQAPPKRPPKI